jgi:DNA (cytosine-5)-methyltransferase 1
MGFPNTYRIPVSDTQAYRQFGNSVVVPVIRAVAELMRPEIEVIRRYEETGVLELPLFSLRP